jgi:hypothetical protein
MFEYSIFSENLLSVFGPPGWSGVGPKPLDCWDLGFESPWGHGYSCHLLCVVYVAASATGWSLVERNPTECVRVYVSNYLWSRNPKTSRTRPELDCGANEKKTVFDLWCFPTFYWRNLNIYKDLYGSFPSQPPYYWLKKLCCYLCNSLCPVE